MTIQVLNMNGKTTIQVDGAEIGLRFSYPAIKFFSEHAQKDGNTNYFLPGDSGDFTVEGFARLLQAGNYNDCLVKETTPVIGYERWCDLVDELGNTEDGQKELGRIVVVYASASVVKKQIEEKKRMEEAKSTSTASNDGSTENSGGQSSS